MICNQNTPFVLKYKEIISFWAAVEPGPGGPGHLSGLQRRMHALD